jgi:hypothetical protein
MIRPIRSSRPIHAGDSDAPPARTHLLHTANVVAPPSVSSQQSPHTSERQRAHGLTAMAPHSLQRATEPSPVGINEGTAAGYSVAPLQRDVGTFTDAGVWVMTRCSVPPLQTFCRDSS